MRHMISQKNCQFENISTELVCEILSHLDLGSLGAAFRCCKFIHKHSGSELIWKRLYTRWFSLNQNTIGDSWKENFRSHYLDICWNEEYNPGALTVQNKLTVHSAAKTSQFVWKSIRLGRRAIRGGELKEYFIRVDRMKSEHNTADMAMIGVVEEDSWPRYARGCPGDGSVGVSIDRTSASFSAFCELLFKEGDIVYARIDASENLIFFGTIFESKREKNSLSHNQPGFLLEEPCPFPCARSRWFVVASVVENNSTQFTVLQGHPLREAIDQKIKESNWKDPCWRSEPLDP